MPGENFQGNKWGRVVSRHGAWTISQAGKNEGLLRCLDLLHPIGESGISRLEVNSNCTPRFLTSDRSYLISEAFQAQVNRYQPCLGRLVLMWRLEACG